MAPQDLIWKGAQNQIQITFELRTSFERDPFRIACGGNSVLMGAAAADEAVDLSVDRLGIASDMNASAMKISHRD